MTEMWRWWRSTRTPVRIAFRRPWPTTLRGLILALFSVGFIWIGAVNYLVTDLPPQSQEYLSFALTLTEGSARAWGWVMVAFGLTSLYMSYCHMGRDRIGYVLLATFCAVWGLGYLCGFLFFNADFRAVGAMVIWMLYASILVCCAAIPTITLSDSGRVADACHPNEWEG